MHPLIKQKIFFILLLGVFVQDVYSKNLYIKFDIPIKGKYSNNDYNKDKNLDKISFKISNDNYGFGLGYNFSNYIECELIYNQMKYLTHTYIYNIKTAHLSIDTNSFKNIKFYAAAFPQKNSNTGNIDGITTNTNQLFTLHKEGEVQVNGSKVQVHKLLKSNSVSASQLDELNSSLIHMKLQTLIASLKLKAPTKKKLVPFLILGAGASKMKIDEKHDKLNSVKSNIISTPALVNKTSFAYRAGVGIKFNISSKSSLEISARYFDYGKYKLSNGDKKRIKGHDFSAGIILGF